MTKVKRRRRIGRAELRRAENRAAKGQPVDGSGILRVIDVRPMSSVYAARNSYVKAEIRSLVAAGLRGSTRLYWRGEREQRTTLDRPASERRLGCGSIAPTRKRGEEMAD